MASIWAQEGNSWRRLPPTGFINEAELHALVENAAEVLPLSGSPNIVVLGSEVPFSNGYADLVGVETTGRPVIIEVKLFQNAEARRAVVAQILSYAAALRKLTLEQLEAALWKSGAPATGVAERVAESVGDANFDTEAFREAIGEALPTGRFRLVLVLDDAPLQLQDIVGYLEEMTEGLTIDLITVSAYTVGGSKVIVPQRIDTDRSELPAAPATASNAPVPTFSSTQDFLARIDRAPEARRPFMRRVAEFVDRMVADQLAKPVVRAGQKWTALTAPPVGHSASLFAAYLEGVPDIHVSVLTRLAPQTAPRIWQILGVEEPATRTVQAPFEKFEDGLFEALRAAYEEVAQGKIT